MKPSWALWLAEAELEALGRVRLVSGVQVLPVEDGVWVTGGSLSDAEALAFRSLPTTQRFTIDDHDRLIPLEHHLPVRRLPEGEWQAIKEWMRPDFGLPGRGATPLRFAEIWMAADETPRAVNLLLTHPESWRSWSIQAPAIRLDRLRYAASEDDRIAVRGTPLPPIRGAAYVCEEGIAIAAGYRVEPGLDAQTLSGVLGVEEGDVALIHADGSIEIIQSYEWFPATRSAARRLAQ